MTDEKAFQDSYAQLNAAQKKAVDTVEGPVLVIAGPGTGKTHILTLRIANILRQTQANPANILVLTFTESAARTVRRRLGTLIGDAAAREVFISTFHGFAEHLLSTYSDSFPTARGKRLAGDVEATLLWREVLEEEDITLLRTPKSPFFYLTDLAGLRNDLVRECITTDDYRKWLEEEGERIRCDESLLYVRGEKKGELKPEGEKKLERLEKGMEAARLIEAYEALKEKRDVYDFADVLRICVDGLKADAELLATVQEQYQYMLADEHQDANALQHELLDTLAYDEHPNLFVVGDEKQAIYRFQGADSSHFGAFLKTYPRTEVVNLTDSFRSLQGILDTAHALIQQVPASTGEHPHLVATREGKATIELLAAPDPLAEREQVATLVKEAIAGGTEPHDIAIIASRNATANLFADHLAAKGVPTLRAGDVPLSSRPVLRSILALMRAVADPLDIAALRETLLAPWWPMPMQDRANLLLKNRDYELWTALERAYPDVAGKLHDLQAASLSEAPLPLLSRMIAETGARGYLLSHAEHLEDIALMRRLFMHLEEMVGRDPNRTFADIVSEFTKASEHGLESVKTSATIVEGKVTVITAHKAKGMEFGRVFVVGMNARQWEKGGVAAKIPSPVDQTRTLEDVVKLFYVAATRAKDALVLTYAAETGDGRDLAPSVLIPDDLPLIEAKAEALPMLHATIVPTAAVNDLVRTYLKEEGLSPSALNEYLESPPVFFARRVLRLHEPESTATVIGSSVHAGIAEYLTTKDEDRAYAALEGTLARSLLPRNSVFDTITKDARTRLAAFMREAETGEAIAIEKAFSVKRIIAGKEVLLYGKIDAVFAGAGGERIVDFKTSTKIDPKDEAYPRQLAFYDLLLRENGHAPKEAVIIQVSKDEVNEFPVPLSDETRAELAATLDAAVEELLSGKWREGEPSDYDDLLKLFE